MSPQAHTKVVGAGGDTEGQAVSPITPLLPPLRERAVTGPLVLGFTPSEETL